MKRIFATIFITSAMIANSFAFDFSTAVANFFGIKSTPANINVETKTEVKIQQKQDTKTEVAPAAKMMKLEATSTASSTTETTKYTCNDVDELDTKAEKIKLNIKNQINDREKIVASLQKVASSTATKNVRAVTDKIAEVKLKINSTIEIENDLIEKIENTKKALCAKPEQKSIPQARVMTMSAMSIDAPLSTTSEVSASDIKETEDKVSQNLKEAKVFIKIELKNFLESLQ